MCYVTNTNVVFLGSLVDPNSKHLTVKDVYKRMGLKMLL